MTSTNNQPKETVSNKAFELAVNAMDHISQQGFSRISAIASLAVTAQESRGINHSTSVNVIHALQAISAIAEDSENLINCEAEAVGCNYKDEALHRRLDAQQQLKQSGALK